MNVNESNYKNQIARYFDYSFNFKFLDIIANILERVDDFNDTDSIYNAMDEELIYTCDQWTVIEYYCDPQNASFENALDSLYGDLCSLCEQIAKGE